MFEQSLQDVFVRRFSATTEKTKELELAVEFEFLTKEQMAEEPFFMAQHLDLLDWCFKFLQGRAQYDTSFPQPRAEIDACVEEALKEPEHKVRSLFGRLTCVIAWPLYTPALYLCLLTLRKHPYKKGVLTYYCEVKVSGHASSPCCKIST